MKFVLCFVGVVLFQMISTTYAVPKEFMECIKELGITNDMLKDGPEKSRDKPEFRCLSACLMKKHGELEAGNKINLEKIKENTSMFFKDKINEIVQVRQDCAEQSKSIADECDFAKAISNCIRQKMPDVNNYLKV